MLVTRFGLGSTSIAFVISTILLLPSGHGSWAQGVASKPAEASSAKVADDPISFDSLTLELALIRKTLADQRFLTNDRKGARTAYCEAKRDIGGYFQLSTAKANTLELLKADIDYRLLLLDRGIDFWGAIQTLQPSNPAQHLTALESLLGDFEKQSAEITAASRLIGAANVEQGKLDALSREIDGRVRAQAINQERISIERAFQEDKQQALDTRIGELHSNRKRLENQIAAAVAQANAASAALNRALVNAAASSLGIPPDVITSVKDGKLDKAVLSAVVNSDLLTSSAFSNAISELRANNEVIAGYIKQGQELIRRGKEAKEQFERYKAELETVGAALRKPTIENLARIGQSVYARLDDQTKKEWNEKIRKAKPVIGAYEVIAAISDPNLEGRVREAAQRYLASNANFASDYLRQAVERHVDTLTGDIGTAYADLIAEISKYPLSDGFDVYLVDQVFRHWPEAILEKLPKAAIDGLIKLANVSDRERLREFLRQVGLAPVRPHVRIYNNKVEIYDRAVAPRNLIVTLTIAQLGEIPRVKSIENFGQAIKEDFRDTLDRLRRSEGTARQALLKRLSPDNLEIALRKSLSLPEGADNKEIREVELRDAAWKALVDGLPSAQQEAVVRHVTGSHAASVYMEEYERQKEVISAGESRQFGPQPTSEGNDSGGAGDKQMELMAKLALNAVVPGASVVVDVLASFNAFGDAIDKAKRLAAELQSNLSEELQVIELVNEARLKQVVLGKEREIAALMKRSAQAQYESYRFAITQLGDNQDKERTYIALRRKLTFYLAERLREEYDALDRSLALWAGRANSPRGIIAELIKSDPQNVRLALDSEIHLFDWLSRERESTRTDVDGLLLHWRQLVRLAKDLCNRAGCFAGSGALGQIHQTDAIRLTDLMTEMDRRRYERWKTSGSKDPIIISLFLSADGRFVPLGIDNARVVDVRIGTKWLAGRMTPLTRIRLSHLGVGYIQSQGTTTREVMLPRHRWGHMPPDPFNVQELTESWYQSAGAKAHIFEGYPLHGLWQVQLDSVPENVDPEDPWVRFAYRYIDRQNIVTEREYLDSTGDGPAGIFEAAAVWTNAPEATVVVDGRTTRVALPKEMSVPLPFEIMPFVKAKGPIRPPDKSCDLAIDEKLEAVASNPSTPTIVAVCKKDEDLRRVLISHYRSRGNSTSKARELAEQELSRLKQHECKAKRPIAELEVQR